VATPDKTLSQIVHDQLYASVADRWDGQPWRCNYRDSHFFLLTQDGWLLRPSGTLSLVRRIGFIRTLLLQEGWHVAPIGGLWPRHATCCGAMLRIVSRLAYQIVMARTHAVSRAGDGCLRGA
jgi:hypothetical protein